MRRLSIACVLILMACSPRTIPRTVSYSGFDFTPYTALGFLITPEGYSGEYESIGVVSVTMTPAVRRVPQVKPSKGKGWDAYYGQAEPKSPEELPEQPDERRVGGYYVERIKVAEGIRLLYAQAAGMGGNAIIRFKVETVPFMVNIQGIRLTGFAIRRPNVSVG